MTKPTPTLEEVEKNRSAATAERDRHRDACRRRDEGIWQAIKDAAAANRARIHHEHQDIRAGK